VAWQGCDDGTGGNYTGGDYEIYLWDGTTITQITNNSINDNRPSTVSTDG